MLLFKWKITLYFKNICVFLVSEEAQRKPRVRTPKMEKMLPDESGGAKVEVARGRKRKKSLKAEETDMSVEAGPPSGEVDPITAAIEAVLANASAISAAMDKPKKMKRVKKQDQEGNGTAADEADENDDDSSTAGKVR